MTAGMETLPALLEHAMKTATADEDPPCDGLHDTQASPVHLCTRCFPCDTAAQRGRDERADDEVPQDEDP